jgi:hypothetical protein
MRGQSEAGYFKPTIWAMRGSKAGDGWFQRSDLKEDRASFFCEANGSLWRICESLF